MNVTYHCPYCEQSTRSELSESTQSLTCRQCGKALPVPDGAIEGVRVRRCLICPSDDLFVRKDFPQHLGVTIIVVGFVAATVAWYYYWIITAFAIFFLTAAIDFVLYLVMGEALVCYRCHAHYRAVDNLDEHGHFNLETHERYRQQAARQA